MDDEFTADSFAAFRAKQAATQREAAMTKAVADPETAAILTETRALQQETVDSSRSAAKMIKETVIVGEKTTAQLRNQGEQLRNIEVVAEEADRHAQDAYKQAKDLHKYKGLLPISIKNMFTGARKKAQDSELEKINKKLDKQSKKLEEEGGKAEAGLSPMLAARKSSLGSYANDPAEREINTNLDIISSGLDQLKAQGYAMQKEIVEQNITLAKIEARTDHTSMSSIVPTGRSRSFSEQGQFALMVSNKSMCQYMVVLLKALGDWGGGTGSDGTGAGGVCQTGWQICLQVCLVLEVVLNRLLHLIIPPPEHLPAVDVSQAEACLPDDGIKVLAGLVE